MTRFTNISQKWDCNHFEKMTIKELIELCLLRRAIKVSFKQILINYLIEIGPGFLGR